MGGALIRGIISNEILPAAQVIGADLNEELLKTLQEDTGIAVTTNNLEVVEKAEIIVLSVKPQFYETVISGIRDHINESQRILTIAPKTISFVEELFQKPVKIIRAMPNTPAQVGAGITGVTKNALVTNEEFSEVCHILTACGKVEAVTENLMDVVTAVSGSSPAYVFMFIEAMADAAVLDGMPRAQAYQFAAQAVLGSAKMVLETGKHPGVLKDMVCSPGGTTIEAVRVLEEKGLRSAVIEAMHACVEKTRRL